LQAIEPRPYFDKKLSVVQVGAKQAVSPHVIFFSRMLKKQVVDLGGLVPAKYFDYLNP
jgi:hypothetical protein